MKHLRYIYSYLKISEEEDAGIAHSVPLVRSGSADSDNACTKIHVQKEAGTGGHWCARIVFFALLAGLLGVLGLIILEHRGTADGILCYISAFPTRTQAKQLEFSEADFCF